MPDYVQSLWLGPRLSTMERLCINSFLRNGIGYRLYAYEDIEGVPDATTVLDANKIIPASEIPCYRSSRPEGDRSTFSNAFRYKLLLEQGGIWVDTDVACLRPFTLDDPYRFQISKNLDGTTFIESALIKVPPDSELMQVCCRSAAKLKGATFAWGSLGPQLLQQQVEHLRLASFTRTDLFVPICWEETEQFCSMSLKARWRFHRSKAPLVHFCNEMWRLAGRDKNRRYPGSIYSALQERYL